MHLGEISLVLPYHPFKIDIRNRLQNNFLASMTSHGGRKEVDCESVTVGGCSEKNTLVLHSSIIDLMVISVFPPSSKNTEKPYPKYLLGRSDICTLP